MSKKVGYAVVGLGVGKNHAKAAYNSKNADLIAVCDLIQEKLDKAKEDYPGVITYTDFDEMLKNPDIDIVYPEEGAYVFLDNWVIPKGAKNEDNAYAFINFMMSAEGAKMNIEDFPYLCPNDAALESMGEEYVNNIAKNVPAEVISGGEFVKYLDSDTLAKYDEMWTKLKK